MSSDKLKVGTKVVLIKGEKSVHYRDVCKIIDNVPSGAYDYIIQTVHGTYKLMCRERQIRKATRKEQQGGYRL